MLPILVQLSENDKRLIIAFFIGFIFLLVLIGVIAIHIKNRFKKSAKLVDKFMYDLCYYKIVTDEKEFKRIAFHKSRYYFFMKSWIPILLMVIGWSIIGIYCLVVSDPDISFLFSKDEGLPTLFFCFDWKNTPITKVFGIPLIASWPPILVTEAGRRCTPQFLYYSAKAWISYISLPLLFVGFIWYLLTVTALIARTLRIRKMSVQTFIKDLESINQEKRATPVPEKKETEEKLE